MADAMDSKSISRKGVGVQVPASAPRPSERDPLATALLPVVLHGLNNATQVLSSLNALLALESPENGGEVLTSRAGDLAHASRQVDELGWMLALVGSASGANVLYARRERAGLRPLVASVRAALRKEARDLAHAERPLPGLASDVADGWQLPWVIGTWIWTSARALPQRSTLDWKLGRSGGHWELVCDSPFSDAHDVIARRWRSPLGALECDRAAPGACVIRFPGEWLESEEPV